MPILRDCKVCVVYQPTPPLSSALSSPVPSPRHKDSDDDTDPRLDALFHFDCSEFVKNSYVISFIGDVVQRQQRSSVHPLSKLLLELFYRHY